MKKFNAIEWQSFSLKKDIELIVKKLKDNREIQYSLIFQIALVIFGAALPKIFAIDNERYVWITLSVLGFTPFLYLGLKWICRKCKINKRTSDLMNPQDFIDIFDNKIAYYILISESYCTIFTEALQDNNTSINIAPEKILNFYYIQASYYFQKAITNLSPLNNIVNEVLSSNEDDIITYKLISLPRYINITNLLTAIYEHLETHKSIIKDIDEGELIIKLNQRYKNLLDALNRAISASRKK